MGEKRGCVVAFSSRQLVIKPPLRKALCQECVELRLGVPGMCLTEAAIGAGKRCKWLIHKPIEPALTVRKSACRWFNSTPGHQ
jgi:uncharacterized protein YodC (DUF2158 family)